MSTINILDQKLMFVRLAEKTHQTISCYSVEDAPAKPFELVNLETELAESRNQEAKVHVRFKNLCDNVSKS
jgi:hypothetical protein